MKKILCLILALICILMGMCGCSSHSSTEENSSVSVTENRISESSAEKDINTTTAVDASVDVSDTTTQKSSASANQSKSTNSTTSAPKQNSDSQSTTQDKYKTDPVPDGKPLPKEPESQTVDTTKRYTCTFSIECSTVLDNLEDLDSDKVDIVPKNGVILSSQTVTFNDGESVYDVLQRVCRENRIHMEASWTPMYNSAYVEGINNLYEFDCGSGSGWMYRVNGWYPNYGCSRYQLKQGDKVEWRYTCNLGKDIGGKNAVG